MSKHAKVAATRATPLEWGVAARALPGQSSSGDSFVVVECDDAILVAVIDALGHGTAAAATAEVAAETLRVHAGEPIQFLVQRCHEALVGTRGAVITVASIDCRDGTMAWLGVGDIEGILAFADRSAVPTHVVLTTLGGIVGAHLPSIRPWFIPVARGDTLVFTTDGIRSGIAASLSLLGTPQLLADEILARGFKGTDDALVLVARVRQSIGDAS